MALSELGHLSAFGARIRSGKRMRLRLGRGEPPLPPLHAAEGCSFPRGAVPQHPGPASPGRGGLCPPLG